MVIAPSRVERVPGTGVKTDRVDVRALARKRVGPSGGVTQVGRLAP